MTSPRRGPRATAKPGRGSPKGTVSVPPGDMSVPGEVWVGELPASERVAFEAAIREGRERGQAEREAHDARLREEYELAVRGLPGGDRIPNLVRPITEGRPATGREWVLLHELQEVVEREQRRQALDQITAAAGLSVRPEGDALRLSEPRPPGESGAALIITREEVEPRRADRSRVARGRGRPGWTDELFWTRYQEALGRATPPYTYRAVALHFDALDGTRGTDPEYLRKLVRRHGLPPE